MGQELSTSVKGTSQETPLLGNKTLMAAHYHPAGSERQLADDYEVLRKAVLGNGSGSVVVRAVGRANRQSYAVKTLDLRKMPLDWQKVAAGEAEILLKLDHPNIVRLHDVYEAENGVTHLVMECCTGGELFSRIATRGAYNETEAANAMAQMLRAVGYLHAHGIVHRDLKPENFLYESKSPDAWLKLIDFGFGKVWEPLTLMKECCGSLTYVSPEVLEQEGYTNKCDLWSLGVIGYMLLMGHAPFEEQCARALRSKIKEGRVGVLQAMKLRRWNALSPDATDFVKKLLEKDPQERLSAQEAIFHPWLIREGATSQMNQSGSPLLGAGLVASMEHYVRTPALQRAALQLLAQEIRPTEVKELRTIFLALDKMNEGVVYLSDLKAALSRTQRAVESLQWGQDCLDFDSLNVDLSEVMGEQISYTEFLAAVLGPRASLYKTAAHGAFDRLDADCSGEITEADLRKAFDGSFSQNDVTEWLQEAASTFEDGLNVTFDAFLSTLDRQWVL